MTKTICGILILVTLLITGCDNTPRQPFVYTTQLEAVMQVTEKSPANGGFFLFFGAVSGGKVTTKVSFAWRLDNEILFSTLDTRDIRLSFDDTYEQPQVKFVFNAWVFDEREFRKDPSDSVRYNAKYVTIMCKRELWNPVFQLPMSEEK